MTVPTTWADALDGWLVSDPELCTFLENRTDFVTFVAMLTARADKLRAIQATYSAIEEKLFTEVRPGEQYQPTDEVKRLAEQLVLLLTIRDDAGVD